jgi:hypothetical protein
MSSTKYYQQQQQYRQAQHLRHHCWFACCCTTLRYWISRAYQCLLYRLDLEWRCCVCRKHIGCTNHPNHCSMPILRSTTTSTTTNKPPQHSQHVNELYYLPRFKSFAKCCTKNENNDIDRCTICNDKSIASYAIYMQRQLRSQPMLDCNLMYHTCAITANNNLKVYSLSRSLSLSLSD